MNQRASDRDLSEGFNLHRAGKLSEAEAIYRKVLALEPRHRDALHLMGVLLYHAGRAPESVEFFRKAAPFHESNAEFFNNFALALTAAENLDEGAKFFGKALAVNPQFAEARYNLALTFTRLGQHEDALKAFEQAHAVQPSENGKLLVRAGQTAQAAGRPVKAAKWFELALQREPDNIDALVGLGDSPTEAIDRDGAFACYEKSILLAPEDPRVLTGYARHLEERQRLEEAANFAEKALAFDFQNLGAKITLARVAFRQRHLETALSRLEDILSIAELDPLAAADAYNLKALVLDRLDRPREAFNAFRRSAEAMAESPIARILDRSFYPDRIVRLKDFFSGEVGESWPSEAIGPGPSDPVFFVGFPRSGTTLVEQALASHFRMQCTAEHPALHQVIESMPNALGRPFRYPEDLSTLRESEIARLRSSYWSFIGPSLEASAESRRVVDKLPLNLIDLGLVRLVFPKSKIIVALRDPRDVCLSCFMQNFELNNAMIHFMDLEDTARFYVQVMDLWRHYETSLGLDTLTYRYEDLVSGFETTMRRIVGFLNEPWDDNVLNYANSSSQRTVSTPSYRDVTEKIYDRAVGRWRRYESELEQAKAILAPMISTFGYPSD